jgi:PAS domain S-box-containing protein
MFLGVLFSLLLFLLGQRSRLLKASLQSQEELSLILEKANEGFISIDEQSLIVNWNPYASELFGWKKEEVLNKPLQEFIVPPKYRKLHIQGMNKFLNTGDGPVINKTIEITGYHRTKKEFPIELTIFPIRFQGKYTFHAFIRDISERKEVEKMKNEFISVVSHELRTPLTSIIGSFGLLLGLKDINLPKKYYQLLSVAKKNCDRLINLINDILDMEKIEAGKMTLRQEEINITTLIQDTINLSEEYANSFGVTVLLKNRLDCKIIGDYGKLQQVLTNLISNAIKFSKQGGVVTIHSIQKDKKTLQVEVSDNGIGIPEDFQPEIFIKFAQADSTSTRPKGGTGLGLSISKVIIEMHGGSLSFTSKENEGTTFFVKLPIPSE